MPVSALISIRMDCSPMLVYYVFASPIASVMRIGAGSVEANFLLKKFIDTWMLHTAACTLPTTKLLRLLFI